ncbi:hypothetical protein LZK75_11240 [Rhizobium leguminosarum]|nr:hypothetical protein LZK75_11240 [Rhizobium leguminosarum]
MANKNFHKTVSVAASAHNCNSVGEITLATLNADSYINLITSARSLTISPEEAKKLRDLLVEAYPLEAPAAATKPTKFKAGDKVTYKSIVGYGARGMDGRKGSIKEVLTNEWYMVNFTGGPFDNLIKVHPTTSWPSRSRLLVASRSVIAFAAFRAAARVASSR